MLHPYGGSEVDQPVDSWISRLVPLEFWSDISFLSVFKNLFWLLHNNISQFPPQLWVHSIRIHGVMYAQII